MERVYSVMVVGADPDTADDIQRALTLGSVSSVVAPDLAAATRLLGDVRPSLILTRQPMPGVQVPWALMLSEREQAAHPAVPHGCLGVVRIPVAFPAVTYQVQDLLMRATAPDAGLETATTAKANSMAVAPGGAALPQDLTQLKATAPESEHGGDQADRDRRFYVVHAVHHHVLQDLAADSRFTEVSIQELPALVAEVTARICGSFSAPRRQR